MARSRRKVDGITIININPLMPETFWKSPSRLLLDYSFLFFSSMNEVLGNDAEKYLKESSRSRLLKAISKIGRPVLGTAVIDGLGEMRYAGQCLIYIIELLSSINQILVVEDI